MDDLKGGLSAIGIYLLLLALACALFVGAVLWLTMSLVYQLVGVTSLPWGRP